MKFFSLLIFILITFLSKAQVISEMKDCELDSINGRVLHFLAEIQPEYEGGLPKFYRDITSKIRTKEGSKLGGIKVILSFVIDEEGMLLGDGKPIETSVSRKTYLG